MAKQFMFHNLANPNYDRLVWEEELEDKMGTKEVNKLQLLEVGETCKYHDPFILIERVPNG